MNHTIQTLLEAGLSVLPVKADKTPALPSWTALQASAASLEAASGWGLPIALIGGTVSGGLVCVDFDQRGRAFRPVADIIASELPDAGKRLCVQRTPSGGYHVIYRTPAPCKSGKLAMCSDGTLIETKSEGGYFLIAPSDGYTMLRGDLADIKMLSEEEHENLLSICRSFDETPIEAPRPAAPRRDDIGGTSPLDDYDNKNDPLSELEAAGWVVAYKRGEAVYLRRPGKAGRAISASWNHIPGRFFCFSTSTPFENNHIYKPSAVYAILRHGGDYSAAARELARIGYGKRPVQPPSATAEKQRVSEPDILDIDDCLDRYERECEMNSRGIILGYDMIDDYTGGLRGGDLLSILANPGCYKTTLLLNFFFRGCCTDIPGSLLLCSFEMGIEQTTERNIQIWAQNKRPLAMRRFAKDKTPEWATVRKMAKEEERVRRIYMPAAASMSLADIESAIEVTEKKSGQKVILVGVDYLDFIDEKGTQYEKVMAVMLGFKTLLKRKGCAGIILAQTNRTIDDQDEEVNMRSGKGGTAIEASSDFMVGLWEYENDIVGRVLKHRRIAYDGDIEARRYFRLDIERRTYTINAMIPIERPKKEAGSKPW